MGQLTTYLTALQNLLGTTATGALYDTPTLTTYINTARNRVAQDGQCIRVVPPISGPITAITLNSGGSGYSAAPQVIISSPDFPLASGPFPNGLQATAIATISGGAVISVLFSGVGGGAGNGYYAPIVTFSGVTAGTVATATAIVSGVNQTVTGQEVYPFSAINPLVASSGSGILSIHMVNGISLIWGTFRYTLLHTSFSKYQAKVRNYTVGYQYIPSISCQFGQGANGSVYTYPLPNQPYQMEWDCCCLPTPILTDTDPEPIPYNWQEAVPFYAAYYAFNGKQRFADAQGMLKEYQRLMVQARQTSNPRATTSWYGRSI